MKAAVLLALATVLGGAQHLPAPRLERIEFEVKSWGRELVRWQIDAEGNGSRTETDAFGQNGKITSDFAVGRAGFRKLRVMLGVPEVNAGRVLTCIDRATDLPYGEVRWTGAHRRVRTLKYDTGYKGGSTMEVLRQIRRADAQVESWAKRP